MRSISLLFSFRLIVGWGGDGHAIVTHVARTLLSDQGSYLVNSLIDSDHLIEASQWADTEDASKKYPESDEYHFSHTPYRNCTDFVMHRDCGFPGKEGLCIVTGLADSIRIVADPDNDKESRVDAFKFILHLMADIHQPLHTGFRKDAGGTAIDIANGSNMTLHEMWDYGIIENVLEGKDWETMSESILKSVNLNGRKFVDRIAAGQPNLTAILSTGNTSNIIDYVASMASDTSTTATCKLAYTNELGKYIEKGEMLSEDYMRHRRLSVQVQLSKAAVRLALLINAIADIYNARVAERKEVRREIRIEKLFEESRRIANETAARIRDPIAGNYFRELAIDFDEAKCLYSDAPITFPDVTRMTKEQRRARRELIKAENERRLQDERRREERKKRARLVDGIDLNSLVLIKREDRYVITLDTLVGPRIPKSYLPMLVRFANRGKDAIEFLLDNRVFVNIPSQELLTRIFRALNRDEEPSGSDDSDFTTTGTDPILVAEPRKTVKASAFESLMGHEAAQEVADMLNRERHDGGGRLPVKMLKNVISMVAGSEAVSHMDESATSYLELMGTPTTPAHAHYVRMMDELMKVRLPPGTTITTKTMSVKARLEAARRQNEINMARLKKFEAEIVFIPIARNTAVVSILSSCTNTSKNVFEFNRFGNLDSDDPQAGIFLIDRELLDEPLTEEAHKFIYRSKWSEHGKKRIKQVQKKNNNFIGQLGHFALALGFGNGIPNAFELAYFKEFSVIDRPDKPELKSIRVDLSPNPFKDEILTQLGEVTTALTSGEWR